MAGTSEGSWGSRSASSQGCNPIPHFSTTPREMAQVSRWCARRPGCLAQPELCIALHRPCWGKKRSTSQFDSEKPFALQPDPVWPPLPILAEIQVACRISAYVHLSQREVSSPAFPHILTDNQHIHEIEITPAKTKSHFFRRRERVRKFSSSIRLQYGVMNRTTDGNSPVVFNPRSHTW